MSKNGRLLLNVGPKSDGTICPEETAILMEIGDWMKINGEAIYGTRPWRKSGEGPTKIEEGEFKDFIKKNFTSEDFRFTCKGGILYATALKCSKNGEYCIRSLAAYNSEQKTGFNGILQEISVLGSGIKPEWKQTEDGLYLKAEVVSDKPIVFCIKID